MGPQVIWLLGSYALMASFGIVFLETGHSTIGYAILLLFPAIRVARRFRTQGGYRLMGGAGQVSGNISQRGGFASRTEQPFFFWACLFVEILAIAGMAAHFFTR